MILFLGDIFVFPPTSKQISWCATRNNSAMPLNTDLDTREYFFSATRYLIGLRRSGDVYYTAVIALGRDFQPMFCEEDLGGFDVDVKR